MPRTWEEEQEYQRLSAELAPPDDFLTRLGKGAANMPGYLAGIGGQTALGVTGLLFGDEQLKEAARREKAYQFYDLPAPQTGGQITADILTKAPPEIVAALAPMSLASKGAEALGAAPRWANVIGSTVAGALSGARHSGEEAGIQAGEFGVGQTAAEFIPGGTIPKTLMRIAAQAAVPIAGQIARGNAPTSKEGLIQAAVQAGLQAIHDRATFRMAAPEVQTKPMMERYQPSPGLAAELGLDVPGANIEQRAPSGQTEEDLFNEVFGGQQPTTSNVAAPSQGGPLMKVGLMTKEDVLRVKGFKPMLPPVAEAGLHTIPETEGDLLSLIRKKEHAAPTLSQPESLRVEPEGGTPRGKTEEASARDRLQRAAEGEIPNEAPQQVSPHPAPEGEGVINTAVRLPSGQVLHGDEPLAGHPTIFPKAPEDVPVEDLFNGAGFWIKDAQGKQRFATREEGLQLTLRNGQIFPDQALGVTKLSSEMLREAAARRAAGEIPEQPKVVQKEMLPPGAKGAPTAPETQKLGATLSLLKKAEPKPTANVEAQRAALEKNLSDKRSEWNTAKAVGDHEDAAAILGEISVMQKALKKLEAPAEEAPAPKKFKLKAKAPQQAMTINPVAGAITRGAVGAAVGYAQGGTEEERLKRAALYGGAALFGPALIKKAIGGAMMLKPALEAAARRESGVEGNMAPSLLGKAVLASERLMNVGKRQQLVTAEERGKGALADIRNRTIPILQRTEAAFHEAWADPSNRAVAEKFITSKGAPSDVAALEASSVPQAMKDWLKTEKAAKIEGQRVLAEAEPESSPRKKLIKSTEGTWQTNVYQIDVDPNKWRLNEQLLPKVVDEMKQGPLKDFSKEEIERGLRQNLNDRLKGVDPNLAPRKGTRIQQKLYEHLMDLTPQQWEFLDQMSVDPRTPRGAGPVLAKFFADKSIDPSGQMFVKALAGNKALSDSERQMFRDIGDKKVITQNYRDLLGQIKDPAQRELYSLNKLFTNITQAKTISEIANTVLPNGARLAYIADTSGAKVNPAGMVLDQAKADALAAGNTALHHELQGYVQLPDNPALGKLSGALVPRDVSNTINEIQSTMGTLHRFFAKANSITKEVATVWNPSTQVRQAVQTPFFMLAARVSPIQIVDAIKQVAADTRLGKSMGIQGAMVSELHQQHMLGANYSEAELNSFARKLASGNTGNPLVKTLKSIRGAVMGLYGIPDDLVRVASYLSQKPRFLKEASAKGLVGDVAEKYARDTATMWVNEHAMNYGQVPKAIKILRQFPVVSPFASYSYEMVRLTKNLLKDIAVGDASDKLWATAGLTALYAFPVALASWAKNKFLSKDEQKEFDHTEALMPQDQRGQLKLVLGKNPEGSFKYQGLNPWMPAGDMISTIQSAAKGDWESLKATQPFFGWQKSPIASAFVDAFMKGEHSFTHQKLDTPEKQAGRIAEAFVPSLTPKIGFAAKKLERGFTRSDAGTLGEIDPRTGNIINPQTALLSLVGINQQVANPMMLRRSAYYQGLSRIDDAKRELFRITRSGAPQRQKDEAIRQFEEKRAMIAKEMQGLGE